MAEVWPSHPGSCSIAAPESGLLCGGASCESRTITSRPTAFEVTSKRRKGFPSETRVQRGDRVVGQGKELLEKLGRNDPCPCLSGRRFQALLHADRRLRWLRPPLLLSGSNMSAMRGGSLT
ncbi:MAG: SEC-C metal-binding domain-containing protein [Steroidobacteraceae bacterium]